MQTGIIAVCVYLVLLFGGYCLEAKAASSSALSEEAQPMMTEAEVKAKKRLPSDSHDVTLSNKSKPLVTKSQEPTPTPPIFEWGDPFLKNGNISPGITLPTGAIWQPGLWVFGDVRAGIGFYDGHVAKPSQYGVGSLNLFFNLKLSPTERISWGSTP